MGQRRDRERMEAEKIMARDMKGTSTGRAMGPWWERKVER